MKRFKRRLTAVLSLLALALSVPAKVSAIPLADLVGGSTVQILDKLFVDWHVVDNSGGVDLGLIDVAALADDPLNPGFRYVASQDALSLGAGNPTLGLVFGFRVVALDPDFRIKDNSLDLTGFDFQGSSSPSSAIFIDELACFDQQPGPTGCTPGNQAAFKLVSADATGIQNLSAQADFAPTSELFVRTSVFLGVDSGSGRTVLTSFEQRFSQTTVPAPATLGLLLLGAALAARRRSPCARRRSAA